MHEEMFLGEGVVEAIKPLSSGARAKVLEAVFRHVAFGEGEPEGFDFYLQSIYRFVAKSVDREREY